MRASDIILTGVSLNFQVSQDSRMNLNGELNVFFGLLGGAFMVIPGIASIPAVGSLLNWREWKLVQSAIGLLAIAFSTTHVTLKGAYDWRYETFSEIVQSMAFVSSFLPWVCFALIIILWMPCFYFPLRRIRRGWERGISHDDDEETRGGSPKVTPAAPSVTSLSNGYGKARNNNGYVSDNVDTVM